jgi:CRP-like cAMP-binding protein
MNNDTIERLQAKTPQQRFTRMLEKEFHFAPKIAQAVLEEAEAYLGGHPGRLRPGQVCTTLVKRGARHGQALRELDTTEVVWTIDAGVEDHRVLQQHGRKALRRARLQRLALEALEQGAVATQEDLAQALQVSVRTIKRDVEKLQGEGGYVPTRGKLQGIGRGQSHKAQIIGRWLQGETYDQIALHTHHAIASIKRYIQTFVRVVQLHRHGFAEGQIALLVQNGAPLVREYLKVYEQHSKPECRERLEAQLLRLGKASQTRTSGKRGAK